MLMRTAVALFCAGIALFLLGLGWGWLVLSLPFGAWLALYALEYLWSVPVWIVDRLCQDTPARSGASSRETPVVETVIDGEVELEHR